MAEPRQVDEAEVERAFREEYGGIEAIDKPRSNADVLLLRRALVNEKAAPEILEFEAELVSSLKGLVDEQEAKLDKAKHNVGSAFRNTLVQMELDRVKFVLVEYLRARLRKIQAHTLHILGHAEINTRLSEHELEFAKAFIDLQAEHVARVALDKLPSVYQSFTERTEEVDMVPAPDLNEFVFCRVERDLGDVQVEDDGNVNPANMMKGDLIAIRYLPIKQLVADGDLVLV